MSDLLDELHRLEESLLDPAVRRSPTAVEHLLTPEFREFGASGHVYTRAEIVAALATEPAATIALDDFALTPIADGAVLATCRTYRTDSSAHSQPGAEAGYARRSSIWVHRQGRWQMLFHQGTRLAEE